MAAVVVGTCAHSSLISGGSATGLSATDAWLGAAAGDEMRLSFVVNGIVSFAGVRRYAGQDGVERMARRL